MKETTLEPGWLQRVADQARTEFAAWPEWMKTDLEGEADSMTHDGKSATERIAELEAENARLNLHAAQDRSYLKMLRRLYERYRDKAKLLERSTKPDEAAVMLRERTLKLRKAEHDRDRYKRKIAAAEAERDQYREIASIVCLDLELLHEIANEETLTADEWKSQVNDTHAKMTEALKDPKARRERFQACKMLGEVLTLPAPEQGE